MGCGWLTFSGREKLFQIAAGFARGVTATRAAKQDGPIALIGFLRATPPDPENFPHRGTTALVFSEGRGAVGYRRIRMPENVGYLRANLTSQSPHHREAPPSP